MKGMTFMEIVKKNSEDGIVLELTGKLDTNTAPELETTITSLLVSEEVKNLELDMAGITYLSSAGLRVLLATQKKINALQGQMVITNASKTLKEVFEITGFMGILTIA